jgi:hypothetical protein
MTPSRRSCECTGKLRASNFRKRFFVKGGREMKNEQKTTDSTSKVGAEIGAPFYKIDHFQSPTINIILDWYSKHTRHQEMLRLLSSIGPSPVRTKLLTDPIILNIASEEQTALLQMVKAVTELEERCGESVH